MPANFKGHRVAEMRLKHPVLTWMQVLGHLGRVLTAVYHFLVLQHFQSDALCVEVIFVELVMLS